MERIIQQPIGRLTGGAEGAGDAQDPSRTIASERALNGAIVAGLFPTTHPEQTIRLRIVTRIVSNSGTRSWATVGDRLETMANLSTVLTSYILLPSPSFSRDKNLRMPR